MYSISSSIIPFDNQYKDSLQRILIKGTESTDRTSVGKNFKVFNVNYDICMSHGGNQYVLPAITGRKVFPKNALEELLWYLRGSTDVSELNSKGVNVWNGNSSREFLDSAGLKSLKEGHIGKAYGHQFRKLPGNDQFKELCYNLIHNPDSRRMLINLWNPNDLKEMALTPCAYCYDFMVEGNLLHLKLIQRSGDMILGVPTNIMIAAFFQNLLCKLLGFTPGRLAHSITNAHIYENLIEATHLILSNYGKVPSIDGTPRQRDAFFSFSNPMLDGFEIGDRNFEDVFEDIMHIIDNLSYENSVKDLDYKSHPAIDKSLLVMAI